MSRGRFIVAVSPAAGKTECADSPEVAARP